MYRSENCGLQRIGLRGVSEAGRWGGGGGGTKDRDSASLAFSTSRRHRGSGVRLHFERVHAFKRPPLHSPRYLACKRMFSLAGIVPSARAVELDCWYQPGRAPPQTPTGNITDVFGFLTCLHRTTRLTAAADPRGSVQARWAALVPRARASFSNVRRNC